MALGQKNISKLDQPKREDYGGVADDDVLPGANKVLLTCIGVGYTNMNKRTNEKDRSDSNRNFSFISFSPSLSLSVIYYLLIQIVKQFIIHCHS